ncbi:MAG: pilus assembly protein PilB [Candidatus Jettenia sp.]|nr:MAG: pilus assembly protein PilB [Candidatus Jettenia sp. AMX1]MBC6928696.1 pilus assembly protein PilB [Candidatus Jettenia sp.]NUN24136.1 Flp pilus assembly complex ATPase component TadA [Candidatus Jettenia caeni]MCE7880008.1 pilus assembly protein PilB [Candidatus Jettenia sp. AMX1]MCQ3926790.1 pilus assembly protein PilB [Candidatus Jettenia sp.]
MKEKTKVSLKTEAKRKLFGQILKDKGLITEDQIQEALMIQRQKGGLLGDILTSLHYITSEQIMQALSGYLGLEIITLENMDISPEVITMVPAAIAQLYRIVPVSNKNGVLTIVQADALNFEALDDLRLLLKHSIKLMLCQKDEVVRAIEKYYPKKHESVEQLLLEFKEDTSYNAFVRGEYIDIEELKKMAATTPVKKWVNLMFLNAILDKASDIHIEPFEDECKIRFRIDGVLYEKISPPKQLGIPIASRIKLISGMDISERRLPQDGRIQLNVGGTPIDLRVSTLPTKYGESIVMRLLNKSVMSVNLNVLGFRPDELKSIHQLLNKPNGIILVTGPTGSGKTTTLYAALSYLNDIGTKIITTEDPVEYDIDGLIQVQINPSIDVTFANCLRAILRQDPDIILVGEIRDEETAKIAIQASLTGHLVFSTLHTNDAPTTITRLIDMDIKPYLIASTVEVVISQRLVRKICVSCKEEYMPSEESLMELNLTREDVKEKQFFRGKGCSNCRNIGYKGRMGIYEIMVMNEEIRRLTIEQAHTNVIRSVAKRNGMNTLRDSGLTAVYDGLTTIEEVMRETMLV